MVGAAGAVGEGGQTIRTLCVVARFLRTSLLHLQSCGGGRVPGLMLQILKERQDRKEVSRDPTRGRGEF